MPPSGPLFISDPSSSTPAGSRPEAEVVRVQDLGQTGGHNPPVQVSGLFIHFYLSILSFLRFYLFVRDTESGRDPGRGAGRLPRGCRDAGYVRVLL